MKAQEIIMEQILAGLEAGEIPRQKTRVSRGPVNLTSKKSYRGFNSMLLQWKASKNNWTQYRATYKQATALGGQVKKGEKGTSVIFYTLFDKKEVNAKGEHDKIPLLRYYTVFNLSQMEGVDAPIETDKDNHELPTAQNTIAEYMARENIRQEIGEPSYNRVEDAIKMPAIRSFTNSEEYYQAYFHEMTHSTGAEKRLKRPIQNRFGNEDYSKEELVAEVGATILCNETDTQWNIKNTQAYINGRTRYIKDKPGEVITAFTKAMKACEFILNLEQEGASIS